MFYSLTIRLPKESGEGLRALAALKAADKVRGIWQAAGGPASVLSKFETAKRIFFDETKERRQKIEIIYQESYQVFAEWQHEHCNSDDYVAPIAAGAAIQQAIFSMWEDVENYVEFSLPEDIVEYDISEDLWDTCYLASIAYGGGLRNAKNSSKSDLKQFWIWYIDFCIPWAIQEVQKLFVVRAK